jgi:hypothetical protein
LTSSGAATDVMLESLNQKIQGTIQHLTITDDFRQQLTEKGLKSATTYLFARGKDVLNSAFLPILKPIREEKRTNRRRELEANADINAQKAYRMGVIDVKTCLLENRGFTDCFLFQRIEQNIRLAFE